MTKITAQQLYIELKDNFKIQQQIGSVEIILGNVSAKYKGRDAIGDLLQEWIGEWMESQNYYFRTPQNTQEFPDFLLSESDTSDFLEIKTFNADAGPGFDLANFDAYCTSLLDIPERLDSDYLILSYKMIDGELSVDNIWLKKIWELSSASRPNPVKLQTKRGQIYNLRPCTWYSKRPKYPAFETRKAFLEAIAATQLNYPQCKQYREGWLNRVATKYFENTGTKLLS